MTINVVRIENLLAEKGLTKSALAKKCGISPQNVCGIMKRGTCEPRTAGRLATGLGVAVEEIRGGT